MASQTTLELPFQPDLHLTEVMHQRIQSLQQRGRKRQDGERLLRPHEAVYHLDFSQHALHFTHWGVWLAHPGHLTVIATSQLWTPDPTHLMNRQLLDPAGVFWRAEGDDDDTPVHHYEADAQEFGERIAELEKVRKTMYFLLAFEEGVGPDVFEVKTAGGNGGRRARY
ncbi:olfactory marker protein-like [Salmo salar]|uniref:Olfactory marker protein-like n=1 Tax=Salmo salar TaxID=8030 RepID=A0A1S3RLL5_SALSA|nr:olfactory marker protein-like [Salmo salar]|eukprot:XP_014053211.1 PREDICTED: olfactory marker protein-like [Salmo salar]